MENPGLRTLIAFLDHVRQNEPVNYSILSENGHRGYGMVNRYLRFCLNQNLIRIVSVRKGRGRYPSKTYALSERGSKLLTIFENNTEQVGNKKN